MLLVSYLELAGTDCLLLELGVFLRRGLLPNAFAVGIGLIGACLLCAFNFRFCGFILGET